MQDLPLRGGRDGRPSFTSSPCTRRCPQAGLSMAMRITSLRDRSRRGRPSGTPPARAISLACDQPPVPGEQCRRDHGEHLGPPLPGDQPGQGREPRPVGWPVTDTADLGMQDRRRRAPRSATTLTISLGICPGQADTIPQQLTLHAIAAPPLRRVCKSPGLYRTFGGGWMW